MPPFVSAIIPVYNDAKRLALCLDCLAEQDFPREQFEVIVVDNGSDESPRELVESYAFCRFEEESKPGSYAARNRGLSVARGEVLAFTDSDCMPQVGWLSAGVRAVEGLPDGGLAGGRIIVEPRDPRRPNNAEIYDMVFGLNQQGNVEQFRFAATANAFTSRATFDQIGLFNDDLKSGGDMEWGQRAAEAGLPVLWCEEAVIVHPAREKIAQLVVQSRRHVGGRMDKRRTGAKRRQRLRDAWTALRLLLPPLSRLADISQRLRVRELPLRYRFRVFMVAWLLRLNTLYGAVTAVLGKKTERR